MKIKTNKHLVFGIVGCFVLVAGFSFWGSSFKLSSAVVAPGVVEVDGVVYVIEHLMGGEVASINVNAGDKVQKGDLLILLSTELINSELEKNEQGIVQMLGNLSLYKSIHQKADKIIWDSRFVRIANVFDRYSGLMSRYKELYQFSLYTIMQTSREIEMEIATRDAEILGLHDQLEQLRQKRVFEYENLEAIRKLLSKGVAAIAEVRQQRIIITDIEYLISIAETKLATLIEEKKRFQIQLDEVYANIRGEQLLKVHDHEAKLRLLYEERETLLRQKNAAELRSPETGKVHAISVASKGDVVAAGETVMRIIPQTSQFIVKARLSPTYVDQVYAGQDASLNFNAFVTKSGVPQFSSEVLSISADVYHDERLRQSWYEVILSIGEWVGAFDEEFEFRPGMLVDTFIETRPRTLFDYLLQPVKVFFDRAMIEG